jgi:hypothetical protein
VRDAYITELSSILSTALQIDAVPLGRRGLLQASHNNKGRPQIDILQWALGMLPMPRDQHTWQELVAFKAENRDHYLAFLRFLRTSTSGNVSETALRDEVEWLLHQYEQAMSLIRLKANFGLVRFVITSVEILEDAVKLKFLSLAKRLLTERKRKIDLLEYEMKSPGRELAYLHIARQRFG